MKEKTRRTAKQYLKTLVTTLTMIFEDNEQDRHIPELTRKALMIAIDSLKKGKSADSKGIKAEHVKGVDEETITMIHESVNLIIKQNSMVPSVIHKKGRDKS